MCCRVTAVNSNWPCPYWASSIQRATRAVSPIKLFTLLPIGTIAYRVNLFSAASAALAVGAFYLVALGMVEAIWNRPIASPSRALGGEATEPLIGRRRYFIIAAAAASLALAFSPTFWSQATMAEVYALNAFFVIALLGLSMWLRESPSFRPARTAANGNGWRSRWV